MRHHMCHFSLLLLAVLVVSACRSRSSPLPSAPKREGGTSPAPGESKPKDVRVNNPLIYRSNEGACETLLAQSGDPFVAWAKHFPVERQGLVATLPVKVTTATDLRKRLTVLRGEMYDVVECEALTLLWIQAIGGCAELDYNAKAFEEAIGPLDVVACFAYNPSECSAPNPSRERCRYLVAPIMDLPQCGAETPEQKAMAERLLIELGLAAPWSKPCKDG